MDFEKSLNRLEEIIRILERGDKNLEEVISLFEEGSKLLKKCNLKLNNFENKIKVLAKDLDKNLNEGNKNGDK